ncbi:MAG TPA: hypothetical protein VGL59_15810 [Polyangia bacterium]
MIGEAPARASGSTKEKAATSSGGGTEEGTGGGAAAFEPGIESVLEQPGSESKHWQLIADVEYHHLLQSDYPPGIAVNGPPDPGNALNRNAVVYDVSASWDITPRDRIWAEWGFIQKFLKNSGDGVCPSSGPDDAIIAYRRTFHLPRRFTVRVQPRVDIGASCESVRYESLIAAPRLGASIERDFGPLFLSFETHGYWYFEKYTSYTSPGGDDLGGGAPTPLTSLHAVLRLAAAMPFYRRLSVGAVASAATIWYHQVGTSNTSGQSLGSVSDPLVPDQPFQNSYGGEVFVRLALPPVNKIYSDIIVAYADGDPTVTGYQSLLHDNGRASFDLFYRNVSEFYTAITFRY